MRRFWMLLLAVVTLAALMAVPAMATEQTHLHGSCISGAACTSCDHDHTGWVGLSTISSITKSGNYYVDTDEGVALEKYFDITTTGIEVTICLNGRVWTGAKKSASDAGAMRPLSVNAASTVNIVDCSGDADGDGVSDGKLMGVDLTWRTKGNNMSRGGVIFMNTDAVVKLYNGTICGGKAYEGGNIYTNNGDLYVYGGAITGGTTQHYVTKNAQNEDVQNEGFGGNIRLNGASAEVHLIGGVVKDGVADRLGGNIYVGNGHVYMGTEGSTSVDSPAITGGNNVVSGCNGGSVNIGASGKFTLYSGKIEDGYAVNAGGNVYTNGLFTMKGGLIKNNNTNANKKTGPNMFVVNGTLDISGGEIVGGISVTNSSAANASQIKVSAHAKITGTGIATSYTGKGTAASKIQIIAPLSADAEITVGNKVAASGETPNTIIAATAENWLDYQAYMVPQPGRETAQIHSGTACTLAFEATGINVYGAGQDWGCYCGFHNNEHLPGCSVYDVKWNAWSAATVTEPGNYRLTSDKETTAQIGIYKKDTSNSFNGKTYKNNKNETKTFSVYKEGKFVFDLNGHNITAKGTRALQSWYGADVTLCNSKVDAEGNRVGGVIKACGQTSEDNFQVWQILNGTNELKDYTNSTSGQSLFTQAFDEEHAILAGVTLQFDRSLNATTKVAKGHGVLELGNSQLHIYGATLVGDPDHTLSESGGVISVSSNAELYLHPGTTIVAGKVAKTGAAVSVSGSNAVVEAEGTTFTAYHNGVKVGSGVNSGLISVTGSGAMVTLTDCLLEGGSATYGGAMYLSGGTVKLNKCTLVAGTASSNGAAIHLNGASLEIVDSNITAYRGETLVGESKSGGLICVNSANSDLTITGSTLVGGKSTNAGGALRVEKAKSVSVSKSTIVAGSQTTTGAAIFHNAAATVTLDDVDILTSGNYSGTCALIYNYSANAVLKLQGGTTVDAGKVSTTENGSAIYVYNGTVELDNARITGGDATNGGAISVRMGKLTLNNTEVIGGNANNGGAIYMANGEVTVKGDSVIRDGGAKNGGNIYVAAGSFTLTDGIVSGGEAVGGNGGNINAATLSTVNISGGTVKNGNAYKDGVQHGHGANIALYGTLNMTGGQLLQEAANLQKLAGEGGNIYMNHKDATANLKGGSINGLVYVGDASSNYEYPRVVLGGDIQIVSDSKDHYSLWLTSREAGNLIVDGVEKAFPTTYAKVELDNLGNAACVGITTNAADAYHPVVDAVTDGSAINTLYSEKAGLYLQSTEQNGLEIVDGEAAEGVSINGGGVIYTMDEAIARLGKDDYITLLNDRSGDTITKSIMLDLNGHNLTDLTLEKGVVLKLFDAGTVDYAVEADAESINGYSGYGVVTLSSKSEGTIARQQNTPKATYGGNYRYIVLKDAKGYHAHRIYITVKAVVLHPNSAAVNFRTVLRCDQVVAKYINAEGGGYGIFVSTEDGQVYGDYTDNGIEVLCWNKEAVEENNRVTRLTNLMKVGESNEVNNARANTSMNAKTYIFLSDDFYGHKLGADVKANKQLIAEYAITSSNVTTSLRAMVAVAFAKEPTSLPQTTRDALYRMYSNWSGVIDSWTGLKYLQEYKDNYEGVNLKYACLCGNTKSINNPCAEAGHPKLTWREWDVKDGKLPASSGNYYLSGDLQLKNQGSVAADQHINLNLNGHNIDSTGDMRIANVYGVLNLVNFGYDGAAVADAAITSVGAPYKDTVQNGAVTGQTGGNGGTLLIFGGGNVSLYSGVTLQMAENSKARSGVVEVGGDLNIYGGHIKGATMKNTYINNAKEEKAVDTYGGAVTLSANGYLYMNSGSITGGEAKYGGTIYSKGRVELEGGSITAGIATEGAMLYVNGGEVESRMDLDASAGMARRGGLAYVNAGKLTLEGSADRKLNITGGTVYTEFNTKQQGGKTVIADGNSKGQAGSGAVIYAKAGTIEMKHCQLNGGAVKQMGLDGAIGEYTEALDNHGGTVLYVAGGIVNVDACQLNGYLGAQASKRGGNLYIAGGMVSIDADEKLGGGSTLTAGWSTVSGAVVHMAGGTFTMNEGTKLDASALSDKEKDGITCGAAVSLSNTTATFNMNGGSITGGVVNAALGYGGGNVNVSGGVFNMAGGSITSGTLKGEAAGEGVGGGNVRIDGGSFNMTGGSVTGGVDNTGNGGGILLYDSTENEAEAALSISGTAYVYENTNGEGSPSNVYLSAGECIALGQLQSTAKIGVTMETEGGSFTSGNTTNTQAALDNGWLLSDQNLETGLGADNQFFIGRFHCLCGASGSVHQKGCSGEQLLWKPWNDTTHLPDQTGNWYLAYDEETEVTMQAEIGSNATEAINVVVDLNGKTVIRANTNNNNRFFAIFSTESLNHSLTITDTSSGKSGKLVCASESNGQGLGVWMEDAGSTFTMYAGTIDASLATATKNGGLALYMERDTIAHMYGGSIIGGVTSKSGAAVFQGVGASFTMDGGSIVGGRVTGNGGAIYLNTNASFVMNDGTIVAGSSLCTQTKGSLKTKTVKIDGVDRTVSYYEYKSTDHGRGGAVMIATGATFTLNGGTVQAPGGVDNYRSAGFGGLFYVEGTLNIHGGTVSGGDLNPTGAVDGAGESVYHDCGYGGNIYVEGTLNMDGGLVTGGKVASSPYATGTYEKDGKTYQYDLGTVGGGCGGNISGSGVLNITGGTISNGQATVGGNIGVNSHLAQITLGASGSAEKTLRVTNGKATTGGNLCINVRPCTSFVINDGAWIEGGHAKNGGNIAITTWSLHNDHYVEIEDGDDEKVTYETTYPCVITINGGTVTGGTALELGGNIYLYGREYTNDDESYPKVRINATVNVGSNATISDGAASVNGNNVFVNAYAALNLAGTIRNSLNKGDQITVGDATVTVSLNSVTVGASTAGMTLEANSSMVNVKAADAQDTPVMRNLMISGGSVTMKGGTITGGYTKENTTSSADFSGANVYVSASTTFTMNGGSITNGVYGFCDSDGEQYGGGGNVLVRGTFHMKGGVISGGKCLTKHDTAADSVTVYSGHGGNVLIYCGNMNMSGNACITGGSVSRSGGNISLYGTTSKNATLTVDGEDALITEGASIRNNGGNIFAYTNTTVTLKAGTISNGVTYDGGGNLYSNGLVKIQGGKVEGGMSGARWSNYNEASAEPTSFKTTGTNSNIFLVNADMEISGGYVDGGIGVTRTTNAERTIKLSGAPQILGTGLYLSATANDKGVYANMQNVTDDGLTKDAVVHIAANSTVLAAQEQGRLCLNVATNSAAYTEKVFKECTPNDAQVVYMEDGLYLYNGKAVRYQCICGANEGESHLPGCDGKEVIWKPWTKAVLPDEPGNWFLSGLTVKSGYVALTSSGSMKYDYYLDENGNYVKLRALLERDEFGKVIQLEDGSFKQLVVDGEPVWLNGAGTAIATLPEGVKVLDSYDIRVDLNGYKLDGPSADRNLTYYGRSSFTSGTAAYKALMDSTLKNYPNVVAVNDAGNEEYLTHRQTPVRYTLTDSSEGHTAVLASYGRFSGKQRNTTNSPQGANIWVYWQKDTLNTYRVTIDSSNVKLGWGLAITTHGTVNLYDSTVIGGVAQAYYGKNEQVEAQNAEGKTVTGYVKTVSGGSTGGGAIHVTATGVVNMYGGTIKDGIALYRNAVGTDGVAVERTIGGGNVFVDGAFNVKGTAEYPAVIIGGMALDYSGDKDNVLSSYSYAQGGGVYLNAGSMTVEGNVSISGNHTGTVGGTECNADGIKAANGTGLGIIEINRSSISLGRESNTFLNGNTLNVKNLGGDEAKVGYSMIGSDWQGAFATVDNGSAAYITSGLLVPDVAQGNTEVIYQEATEQGQKVSYLRYVAKGGDTLQVGYGVASIHPTQKDIANGLSLGGYGNNSYPSSGESLRMTRYWTNPSSTIVATNPNHALNEETAPMQAVAMAFRDTEGDTVIIINLDYNNVSDSVGQKIKQLIANRTGVSVDNITVAASHQHTGPSVGKYYWSDIDGNPTKAYPGDLGPGTTASGTYAQIIYGNELLLPWEAKILRTDYYTTFYTGVVDAAVEAYNDLAPVTSVTAGIMDTTSGGNQFNFVRNIALYNGSDRTKVVGMITDNHRTTYSTSAYQMEYESQLDVTMQLVRYERADKTIVLSNFQSHPHLADGSNNLNPTGGVVYVFRDQLSALYGTEDKPCQVLYFSGAGGNVNSSTSITGGGSDKRNDAKRQPWYENNSDKSAAGKTDPDKRAIRAQYHGQKLATLANAFMSNGQMTIAVDAKNANVQVTVQNFQYDVWNEKQAYTVGSYQVPATYSDVKVENAKLLVNWEEGGYLSLPGNFNNSVKYGTTGRSYWHYFCGDQEGNDKIYSFFHANGVRKRYMAHEQGGATTGEFEIKTYDLGGIGFVAAPYEMFQESGQAIKGNVQSTLKNSGNTYFDYSNFPDYVTNGCGYVVAESTTGQTESVSSPYPITIIASQATGAKGYIPSVLGYVNGGYATDTTLFAPGTGEQLVTAYVDMLIGQHSVYTATTEGE